MEGVPSEAAVDLDYSPLESRNGARHVLPHPLTYRTLALKRVGVGVHGKPSNRRTPREAPWAGGRHLMNHP